MSLIDPDHGGHLHTGTDVRREIEGSGPFDLRGGRPNSGARGLVVRVDYSDRERRRAVQVPI